MGLPHSKNNLRTSEANIVPCPYCHHPICYRHGHYLRKATHWFSEIIRIQRYRCPPCKATHSILPVDLLPLCRWWVEDLIVIGEAFASGLSAYALAKILGESLASLLHLKAWIAKADPVALTLTRQEGLLEEKPPRPAPTHSGGGVALGRRWPTWPAFTHAFSRTLYPKRFPIFPVHTILTG